MDIFDSTQYLLKEAYLHSLKGAFTIKEVEGRSSFTMFSSCYTGQD